MLVKTLASSLLALTATASLAHEGHGLSGSHWHASDAFGYVVLGIAVVLAVWAARRK